VFEPATDAEPNSQRSDIDRVAGYGDGRDELTVEHRR
jgi:hypothetical protein